MNWKKLSTYLLLQTILSIAAVCHGAAVPQLTLIPGSSGNVFTLQGTNLEGLAAMDFEFHYDATVMKNPQAVRGNLFPSDAIFNFNPFAPGEIRLFTKIGKTALNGSGTVATITFEGVENAQGSLRIVNTNLINSATGKSILARVQTMGRPKQQQSPETPPTPSQTATETAAPAIQPVPEPSKEGVVTSLVNQTAPVPYNQTHTVTSPVSTTLGSVTLPVNQPEKNTEITSAATNPPESLPPATSPARRRATPEDSAPPSAPDKSVPLKSVTYQSVLERMKEFTGARTPKNLTDLFRPASGQIVRQEPAVTISDGESIVSLRVALPLTLKETPSFSLRKASMASLQQLDDGSWLIEAKPLKNTFEARLTINCDGSTVQFPLVVAPPLEPGSVVWNGSTEEGFARYLKSKEPGSDLNGDGRSDYVDDYIFTANYLARQNDSKPKPAGEKLP